MAELHWGRSGIEYRPLSYFRGHRRQVIPQKYNKSVCFFGEWSLGYRYDG